MYKLLKVPPARHIPSSTVFLPPEEGGLALSDVVSEPGYWQQGHFIRLPLPTQQNPVYSGVPLCYYPEGPAVGGYDSLGIPTVLPRFTVFEDFSYYITRFLGGFRPGTKNTLPKTFRSVFIGWNRAPHQSTEQPAEQDAPEYAQVCSSVLMPRKAGLYTHVGIKSGSQLTSCMPVLAKIGELTVPFSILSPQGVVVIFFPDRVAILVDGEVYDEIPKTPLDTGRAEYITNPITYELTVKIYLNEELVETYEFPPDVSPATHRVPKMLYGQDLVLGGECLLLVETSPAFFATAPNFQPKLVINSTAIAYEAEELKKFAARFSRFRVVLIYFYGAGNVLQDEGQAQTTALLAAALSGLDVISTSYKSTDYTYAEDMWRISIAQYASDFWPS